MPPEMSLTDHRIAGRLSRAAQAIANAESIESALNRGRLNILLLQEGYTDLIAQREVANGYRADAARLLADAERIRERAA